MIQRNISALHCSGTVVAVASLATIALAASLWQAAFSEPSASSLHRWAQTDGTPSKQKMLQGVVTQSEVIDNLERVGIKCGMMDGKSSSLVVIDVHNGTSAFHKGVEVGDKIGDVRPGNGGFNLTFQRGTQTYQVFLRSSAVPFLDQVNHRQIETEIAEAAKQRLKSLALLETNTAGLSKTTMLDAIDGVHMGALRRTPDTSTVEHQTMEGLRWVPETARSIVWNAGVRVLITPSIVDLDESFKTSKPRGVHGGYTAVGGLFMGSANLIAISERVQYRNDLPRLFDCRGIICHEFGHAYDSCLAHKFGTFSLFTSTTKFREVYHDEVTRLTNEQRRRLEYYTQPNGAGESECFAQLFSAICSPSGNDSINTQLVQAFPKTKDLIKSVMADPSICKGLTDE